MNRVAKRPVPPRHRREAKKVAHRLGARQASACLLCGQPGNVRYQGMRDTRSAAPGTWSWRHCSPCGLLWLDPRPGPEQIADLYASYYTHEQNKPQRGWPRWREHVRLALLSATEGYEALAPRSGQRRLAQMIRALGPLDEMARLGLMGLDGRRKGRLLDVGCGSGRLLAVMRRAGWEVAGVEPDPRAAAAARKRYGLAVHAGSLLQAPYAERSFDAIVLSHVLEHVDDPVGLLMACRRLLAVGGRLALSTPNIESRGHQRFGRRWLHLDVPRHFHLFSASSLRALLLRAGFDEISQTTAAKSAASTWLSSAACAGRWLGAIGLPQAVAFHLAEWSAVNRGECCGEELFAWAVARVDEKQRG